MTLFAIIIIKIKSIVIYYVINHAIKMVFCMIISNRLRKHPKILMINSIANLNQLDVYVFSVW